jgi:hypothetical protein
MSDHIIETIAFQHSKSVLAQKKVKAGLRAEELREKLDPEAIICKLEALLVECDTVPILELPRVKLKQEILAVILRKCMPDLRNLEVKEKDGQATTLIIDMKR